jgi:adenylate cyclase class 2
MRKRGATRQGAYNEENVRFDGPGKSTRRTTLRLRVLDGGPRGLLTAKGPARFVGRVKVREETEVAVADAHATLDLLRELGFRVAFTYEKHRTAWLLDGVVVTLDRLAFGWFVELEGPIAVLPEMARSLGLNPGAAVRESYSVLAREHLASSKGAPQSAPSSRMA